MAQRIGPIRKKLAQMIEAKFDVTCHPEDIGQNKTPWARDMDLCLWYVDAETKDHRTIHIYSWDNMTAIVKHGIAIIDGGGLSGIEICRDN